MVNMDDSGTVILYVGKRKSDGKFYRGFNKGGKRGWRPEDKWVTDLADASFYSKRHHLTCGANATRVEYEVVEYTLVSNPLKLEITFNPSERK